MEQHHASSLKPKTLTKYDWMTLPNFVGLKMYWESVYDSMTQCVQLNIFSSSEYECSQLAD